MGHNTLTRVPGAARHEMTRRRTGTATDAELWAIPHLRCITPCCTACGATGGFAALTLS